VPGSVTIAVVTQPSRRSRVPRRSDRSAKWETTKQVGGLTHATCTSMISPH